MEHDQADRSCGVCRNGLIACEYELDGVKKFAALACLCSHGMAKHRVGVRRVDDVLISEALAELWPMGTPAATALVTPSTLARSGVPERMREYTLASWRGHFVDAESQKHAAVVEKWATLPVAKRTDLVLVGPNGTGKTGLAIAAARAALEVGDAVRVEYVPELLVRWRSSYDSDSGAHETRIVDDLIAQSVLILDEAVPSKATDWTEHALTLVVDRRQNATRPTILTLNVPADVTRTTVRSVLSELLGPALFDRLRERAQFLLVAGASRRVTYRGEV